MKKTNKLLALLLVVTLIFGGTAYASFPVKNESKKEQTAKSTEQQELKAAQLNNLENVQTIVKEDVSNAPMPIDEEKLILILLWIFLWGLAGHRWYAGKPTGWNILFILTGGGCGVWAIIDLIAILKGDF
jgi:hypothetical protein